MRYLDQGAGPGGFRKGVASHTRPLLDRTDARPAGAGPFRGAARRASCGNGRRTVAGIARTANAPFAAAGRRGRAGPARRRLAAAVTAGGRRRRFRRGGGPVAASGRTAGRAGLSHRDGQMRVPGRPPPCGGNAVAPGHRRPDQHGRLFLSAVRRGRRPARRRLPLHATSHRQLGPASAALRRPDRRGRRGDRPPLPRRAGSPRRRPACLGSTAAAVAAGPAAVGAAASDGRTLAAAGHRPPRAATARAAARRHRVRRRDAVGVPADGGVPVDAAAHLFAPGGIRGNGFRPSRGAGGQGGVPGARGRGRGRRRRFPDERHGVGDGRAGAAARRGGPGQRQQPDVDPGHAAAALRRPVHRRGPPQPRFRGAGAGLRCPLRPRRHRRDVRARPAGGAGFGRTGRGGSAAGRRAP